MYVSRNRITYHKELRMRSNVMDGKNNTVL